MITKFFASKTTKNNAVTKGKLAEKIAEKYLGKQGLRLIMRRFYSRFGEIDLIMQDSEKTIIFIEVKWRRYKSQQTLTDGLSAVDYNKQLKIYKTALYFLQQQAYNLQQDYRFDVLAITQRGDKKTYNWQQNAFESFD